MSELEQAAEIAAVSRGRVSVVARFSGFENAVSATERDTLVRTGRRIAEFSTGTIGVFIAGANIARRIAEPADTVARRAATGLSKLEQTSGRTAVAHDFIAIIAAFAGFDDVVAATRIHASVWHGVHIANFDPGTIGIFIACAPRIRRITKAARARCGSARTGTAQFNQTAARTTIAVRHIVVVAAFARFDDAVSTSRIHANVWRGNRVANLDPGTIGVFIADANRIDGITRPARTSTRCRAGFAEFEKTNAVATVAAGAIAIVTTFDRSFLAVTANGASQGPASNRIREDRIERTATGVTGKCSQTIRADIRAVICRAAIVVCGIGRVEPRSQRRTELNRPVHEEIIIDIGVIAKTPRRNGDDLRVSNRRRQWIGHRRNRGYIRCIRRTVGHRRHRILVKINGVGVVHTIHNRRIFVRGRIAIGIDETAPAEWTDVCRGLTRIDVETQTKVQVRGIRGNVESRMRSVADDIAGGRSVPFDIPHGQTARSCNHPSRVWHRERKRRLTGSNIDYARHTCHKSGSRHETPDPAMRRPLRKWFVTRMHVTPPWVNKQ